MKTRIDLEISDSGVATVSLCNPAKLNAVNAEMWRGLSAAMRRIDTSSNQARPTFSEPYPPTRTITVAEVCPAPARPYSVTFSHCPSVS